MDISELVKASFEVNKMKWVRNMQYIILNL